MKALVLTAREHLELREVEAPVPAEGEVVVRVSHCGICGSDMHAYLGHDPRRPVPIILGHEVAGVVVSPGPLEGQRVSVNPLVTCGVCDACRSGRENLCAHRQILSMPPRGGGFAQFIAIPPENLVQMPEGLPDWNGALVEPIACGWHCVSKAHTAAQIDLAAVKALVLGGGAIGVGAALSLVAQGARQRVSIYEPNSLRRARLQANLPQFDWLHSDKDLYSDYDLVIDAVGLEVTRQTSTRVVKPGGVIGHIGLGGGDAGLDTRRMTLQEIAFFGTYTYTRLDFAQTAAALFAGALGTFDWVDLADLDDGAEVISQLHAGERSASKVVLKV